MCLGELEILLLVDLHVFSGGVVMSHLHARLNHFLKKLDEIGLFKNGCFPKRTARMARATSMIMLLEQGSSSLGNLGYARVFAVRFQWIDAAVNAGHTTIDRCHFFGVRRRMMSAALVACQPQGI